MPEKSLRIAQIAPLWTRIPPLTYGGIELTVQLLTDELVRRGHDVTLFAAGDAETRAKLQTVCDENVLSLMEKNAAHDYEFYANALVAEALRQSDQFDVMHFHIGSAWAPMSILSKSPALFTLHTRLDVDDFWALRRYPQANAVAISEFQAQLFANQPQEIRPPVVYNGCDFDAFEPRFESGKYLAFLGRMSFDKNPLTAIRIAKSVGMPIVLAGRAQDAGEEKYFHSQIEPLIDGEQVRYLGAVNHAQKNELLANAAALLFPVQWEEPFGLVMIEAMACGTPVVAHRLGSVSEVIDHGVTGFYTGKIDEMPELVRSALALDRRAVREKARARFSYQRMVDDYFSIYSSLIAR